MLPLMATVLLHELEVSPVKRVHSPKLYQNSTFLSIAFCLVGPYINSSRSRYHFLYQLKVYRASGKNYIGTVWTMVWRRAEKLSHSGDYRTDLLTHLLTHYPSTHSLTHPPNRSLTHLLSYLLSYCYVTQFGPLAQSIERGADKTKVVSSNLTRTKEHNMLLRWNNLKIF